MITPVEELLDLIDKSNRVEINKLFSTIDLDSLNEEELSRVIDKALNPTPIKELKLHIRLHPELEFDVSIPLV